MQFNCAYTELVSISKLVPNPKNANKHSQEQIERLAKIIDFQGQRSPVVVSKRSGFITKGHGRLMAMQKLGWDEIAVDYQDYLSEAQEYADIIADNEIARWAELDMSKVVDDLKGLDLGDIDLLGLKDNGFLSGVLGLEEDGNTEDIIGDKIDQETLDKYSKKISSPVYTPKKDVPPSLSEMVSVEKYEELVKEIKNKNLPKEIELFLINSASRHIVFNYENIAEFYCHQNKDIQELMEKSALVIIDFNKAIEGGFVKLTQEIQEIADQNNNDMKDE